MRSIKREIGGDGPEGTVSGGAGRCVAEGKAGGKCFGPSEVEDQVLIV